MVFVRISRVDVCADRRAVSLRMAAAVGHRSVWATTKM